MAYNNKPIVFSDLVYIAAPFSGPDVSQNVSRAVALAKHAYSHKLVPICVHPAVLVGVYGDDNDPDDRARGIRSVSEIAELVGAAGGSFWALLRDDRSLSEGCVRELLAFQTGRVRFIPDDTVYDIDAVQLRTFEGWGLAD